MKTPLNLLAFLLLALVAVTTSACATHDMPPAAPVTDSAAPATTTAEAATDTSSYVILAGDVLQITVWKEDGLDREVLVLPDGSITYPLIGTMQAQGKKASELQDTIKKKLKKLIPDASVTVTIKAALGHTVSVIGQVQKPGEFVINHRMSTIQALSQAGGLTPYASESNVIVLRHDEGAKEISIAVPYSDLAEGEDLDKDIDLHPGDVVVVPTASLF